MTFEVVSTSAGFDALRDDWNRVLARSATATLFSTWEWLRCWWEHYGRGSALRIIVAREGAEASAIFPLAIVGERWKALVPFRTLRLLGDGSSDSDYLDVLAPRAASEELIEAFWEFLYRDPGLRFDLARIFEIPTDSPHYASIQKLLKRNRTPVREQRIGCVYTPLPAEWEAYVASLKPRMRTKVRTLRRRLEEGHRIRLARASSPEDVARVLPSLFELHGRRWERRDQSGVFSDGRKRAFYAAIADLCLRLGWLRFYSLEIDGVGVAHQFCIAHGGVLYLLQEGYDPAWEGQGVGNVLRAMVFQASIEEGLRTYDFLGGVTPHKLSWGGLVKESARFTCLGRGLWGRVYFGLSGLGAAVKQRSPEPEKSGASS